MSFSISMMVRSQGADYGFELNEFDPFFNFRATEFLVNNGPSAYFDWHDDKSWYPEGRNVSGSSQVMLHVTAAITYQIFGGNSDLYDFTILFPAVIGSLTAIIIFALVRVVGGTSAGLFAALLYSVSVPIILRGTLGWFKSEPLGLFYGLLGVYLFLSAIKSENKKITISKMIAGGILLGFGLASWGGIQFFIIPVGIFLLALPFLRKDFGILIWSIPMFVISFLATVMMFERPGAGFVLGLGGVSLIAPTAFFVVCSFIQKISKPEKVIRNCLLLLLAIILVGSALIIINADSQFLPLPSFRYLNAINPFLTTTDPLVDSVAEHATTTISQSFFMHSILMIFAGLGAWILFNKIKSSSLNAFSNDMIWFALIFGITGVYVSSAFLRLELFASLSIIILSSIGLSIILKEIINFKKPIFTNKDKIIKFSSVGVILIFIISPLMTPANGNWISVVDVPPTILNGGTNYQIATNDWKDTLEWIKVNTPPDSVVTAWWDYGYWITTMSDRTTLADNATIDAIQIQNIAKIFLSSPDDAWMMLQEMGSDYVLVFVAAQKLNIPDERNLYLLSGGGDESKKQWFMRIAGEPVAKYLQTDGISGTDYFWNETLLGKMIPFSTLAYVNFNNNQQSAVYVPGYTGVYVDDIKYPSDGNGPLQLVYASPSFTDQKVGPVIGVFVYEVNDEYSATNLFE
ncbi:STT3 domain-containing protein [Nitrosopumilus sp.]|uniref:STT3 domain-containing protein n=1 Tax=Nitrosopumilus sp. TaxID=2024843 RepID=UPI00345C2025